MRLRINDLGIVFRQQPLEAAGAFFLLYCFPMKASTTILMLETEKVYPESHCFGS